jgi:SAM-dependent methyltransferase
MKARAAIKVHETVVKLLANEKRGKLLDAGAGEGALTKELMALGFNVYPIDIDPSIFKLQEVKCEKVDLNERLPYLGGVALGKTFSNRLRFAAIGLGEKRYYNPALAANAFIRKENNILLVKRNIEPFEGQWSLPGGFIEQDETVEEALTREIEEETGLKVKLIGPQKEVINKDSREA